MNGSSFRTCTSPALQASRSRGTGFLHCPPVSSHPYPQLRSNPIPNRHAPLTLLSILLVFLAALSLSGCGGLTSAGTNSAPVSSGSLATSATRLSFGNVDLGGDRILSVTISNAGNSSLTISNVSISGAGFEASGISTGQVLAPKESATLNVTFTPSATGILTGTVALTSNATNSAATVSLSGTGVQSVAHSVTLTWTEGSPAVRGYNVYRSSNSGVSYKKLNSSLVITTQYTDSTVLGGQTYFYAATSLNPGNVESEYSDQVSVTIPTP
jgi:hypothetical protein